MNIFRINTKKGFLEHVKDHKPWNNKVKLAICAIFRDEGRYLKEWIEFHQSVGVEKFILFNNLSNDNYYDVLKPLVKSGVVYLHNWPEHPGQLSAYNFALKKYRNLAEWIAFLDLDEFLFSPSSYQINNILDLYEHQCGIVAQWVLFGSGGNILEPEGSVIESYLQSSGKVNRHFKSIVRPNFTIKFVTPHRALYEQNLVAVDENFTPSPTDYNQNASANILRINHYVTKSVEHFLTKKMILPMADSRSHRNANFFIESELKNNLLEDRILYELRRKKF